jgi:hypothetical protein
MPACHFPPRSSSRPCGDEPSVTVRPRYRDQALLRTDELASFRDQLATLHAAFNGSATFETMEEWLRVDIQGDGRGHFLAQCEANDQPGVGNTLRFEQTELPPMLAALDEVLRAFPVRGGP